MHIFRFRAAAALSAADWMPYFLALDALRHLHLFHLMMASLSLYVAFGKPNRAAADTSSLRWHYAQTFWFHFSKLMLYFFFDAPRNIYCTTNARHATKRSISLIQQSLLLLYMRLFHAPQIFTLAARLLFTVYPDYFGISFRHYGRTLPIFNTDRRFFHYPLFAALRFWSPSHFQSRLYHVSRHSTSPHNFSFFRISLPPHCQSWLADILDNVLWCRFRDFRATRYHLSGVPLCTRMLFHYILSNTLPYAPHASLLNAIFSTSMLTICDIYILKCFLLLSPPHRLLSFDFLYFWHSQSLQTGGALDYQAGRYRQSKFPRTFSLAGAFSCKDIEKAPAHTYTGRLKSDAPYFVFRSPHLCARYLRRYFRLLRWFQSDAHNAMLMPAQYLHALLRHAIAVWGTPIIIFYYPFAAADIGDARPRKMMGWLS